MERILFWILLVMSVAFLAFMQWGGALTGEGLDQQPQPALNAEKIKLLDRSSIVQASAAPPPPPPVVAQSAVQTTLVLAQSDVLTPAAKTCVEWGEFSGSDLSRAEAALSALHLGDALAQRQVEKESAYWVYIPPLKNHAEVTKKVSQLKAHGVDDYFVEQKNGKWHNAISLGVFKTEEAARKYFGALKAKGVISAKMGERASKISLTVFVLKSLDADMAAKVAAIQMDFPGSEQKTVACAN